MRHGCIFLDEVPVVRYHDLVGRLRGRRRLRGTGRVAVAFAGAWGERAVNVHLVERAAWRGGTRTYLCCPSCAAPVLQVLWNATVEQAQCSRCWSTGRLRYRTQEQRRLAAASGVQEAAATM